MLTADDVAANPVLVRKIKRMQAAENAQIQDDFDDDDVRAPANGQPGPDEISSSPLRARTQLKDERRSQALRNKSREVSMVPNSQVEGLARDEQGRPSSSAVTDVIDLEEDDEDAEE